MKQFGPSCGIIYSQGAVLTLRKRGADGYPETGFHLLFGHGDGFSSLQETILSECKAKLRLIHDEGNFPVRGGVSRVYLVNEESALLLPKLHEVKFLTPDDLNSVYVEPRSKRILERFFALSFFYLGYVKEGYDPNSSKQANILISCLRYFQSKGTFPHSEMALFEEMVSHSAPLEDLRKALRYYASLYELDINEWKERMEIDRSFVK